jgi:hypothetical protein
VSDIQERQLTTLGQNIKKLEDGFLMIAKTWKKSILDESLKHKT